MSGLRSRACARPGLWNDRRCRRSRGAGGLIAEYEGRTFAFCRDGCLRAFLAEPAGFAAKAEQAHAISVPASSGPLVIDEGMRRWYESCSCCLSDAYPEIKAALDRACGRQPAGRRRRDLRDRGGRTRTFWRSTGFLIEALTKRQASRSAIERDRPAARALGGAGGSRRSRDRGQQLHEAACEAVQARARKAWRPDGERDAGPSVGRLHRDGRADAVALDHLERDPVRRIPTRRLRRRTPNRGPRCPSWRPRRPRRVGPSSIQRVSRTCSCQAGLFSASATKAKTASGGAWITPV